MIVCIEKLNYRENVSRETFLIKDVIKGKSNQSCTRNRLFLF